MPFRLPGLVPGGGEDFHQFVVVPRFHDEIEGAALHAFHGQGDIGIGRKEDDLHFRGHLLDFPGPVEALVSGVDVRIEVHVQQHHVRPELLQRGDQRSGRREGAHLGEMHGQENFQRPADAQVVIDDEYLSSFHRNKFKKKRFLSQDFSKRKQMLTISALSKGFERFMIETRLRMCVRKTIFVAEKTKPHH